MRSDDEIEKNVELSASVATALAMYDLPVPGGPNNRIPRHGFRFPAKLEPFRPPRKINQSGVVTTRKGTVTSVHIPSLTFSLALRRLYLQRKY